MKVVILAGGLGTRLSEETAVRPKPMVEIGGKPILWHIMKMYSCHGFHEFICCLGYKGYMIKEYFFNYALHNSDVSIDLGTGQVEMRQRFAEPWNVTLLDTGEDTQTGGRLGRVLHLIDDDEVFAFTYGDGVSNIDFGKELAFHRSHGKLATVAAVRPLKRFGALELDGDRVVSFKEKPDGEGGWINGGFFLLSPRVRRLIDGDETIWEHGPLEALASLGELVAYQHDDFWHPMDTLRDKNLLEAMWASGKAPWRNW